MLTRLQVFSQLSGYWPCLWLVSTGTATSNCFLKTTVDPVTSTIGYPLAHLLPSLISISIFISRLPLRRSSSDFILHLHRSSFSSLIIFIARLVFPFVYSCFLELFFLHLHYLYSYSTLPRPQRLVGLLINASYIANINFPCTTALCVSYQTSKCKILLPMPAWMDTNVTTSFLTAPLPIAMVGLLSYCFSILILT
jgi:hypothetical protein